MDKTLFDMLKKECEADKAKALLSLELLGNKRLVLVTILLKISTKMLKKGWHY